MRHGLCKNMRGNKKGQVPGTSKKKKRVRREVKMDKFPTVELGVFTTHLKKREIAHVLPRQRSREEDR